MSLPDLAALGSFISGLAVLVSLVFLYFQLRQIGAQVKQAEKNQQASIRQGRATHLIELITGIANEASLAEALGKAFANANDLTPTQVLQATTHCRAAIFSFEDSFYQHQEGLLNESAFEAFASSTKSVMAMPGWRVGWSGNRNAYGREFVAWMDKLVAETPVAPPADILAQWKNNFVTELAKISPA